MGGYISTKEAAARLNISVRRVQSLIAAGRLPALKIGSRYAIRIADLKALNGRKNGRPARAKSQKDWDAIIKKYSGCLKGLPPDLSTNPKYMEGFGREK
jgi:excisionase family DNA binding protein